MRPLETITENIRRLANQSGLEVPSTLYNPTAQWLKQFTSSSKCRVRYCSEECRIEALKRYHRIACLGSYRNDNSHPINKLNEIWKKMKYHLKGSSAGKGEVFVESLSGLPDNLTPNEDGIWVPLIFSVDSQNASLFAIFSEFSNLRLFLARILYLFEAPFRAFNNIYPNKFSQRFVHFIGHCESVSFMIPKRSTIVRLDWDGNIVGSLHCFDKSVGAACHVLEFNDYLYLGSPFNRFLVRVKSPVPKKPMLQARINNVRYEGMEIEPSLKPRMEKTTTALPVVTKPTVTHARSTPTTLKPVISAKATVVPSASTTTTRTSLKSSTTEKPSTTKTVKSPSMEGTRIPKEPGPIKENIPADNVAPKKEKFKVINKHGKHVEL
ncbi:adipocyte plasma membrane-associated protein Hemomucin-like [Glossina fuscipes fuscipes]